MTRDSGEIGELLAQVDGMIEKAITLDLKTTLYLLQMIRLDLSASVAENDPSNRGRQVLLAYRQDFVKSDK